MPSQSVSHTYRQTHASLPPRASLLVPQLPPVLSIRDEKGKSSPRPRLLTYSYTCRLGLQDATRVRAKSFFSSCQVDEREAALTHSLPLPRRDNIVIISGRAAKCTKRVPNLPPPLNLVASETPPRQWQRHGPITRLGRRTRAMPKMNVRLPSSCSSLSGCLPSAGRTPCRPNLPTLRALPLSVLGTLSSFTRYASFLPRRPKFS